MLSFKYLYATLASLTTLSCITSQEVCLGFNVRINETVKKLPLQVTSFLDLISQSIFVDKTLLINEILTRSRQSVITWPAKWGKTINLDMLRVFVKMEVHPNGTRILPTSSTPNYRIFVNGVYKSDTHKIILEKPLLIADNKYKSVIDKHLGQYPTIYLTFAGMAVTPERDYKYRFKEMIGKAFREHDYMLEVYDIIIRNETNTTSSNPTNTTTEVKLTRAQKKRLEYLAYNREYQRILAQENKEKFIMYMNAEENNNFNISASIRFLSRVLEGHFKKKVFIFVDEYDRLLTTNASQIVQKFLLFALKYNDALDTAILTGTIPLALKATDVEFEQFTNTPLQAFYGFTTKEMDLLYQYYQIPVDEQKQIDYWYGGYQTYDKKIPELIMHPLTICKYLNFRALQSYQRDVIIDDIYFNKICEFPELQYKFSKFLCGKNYWVSFAGMLDPLSNTMLTFSQQFTRMYYGLRYLMAMGYIVKNPIQEAPGPDYSDKGTRQEYNLKTPNFQNSIDLQMIFSSKLDKIFDNNLVELLNSMATKWGIFLDNNESTTQELANQIKTSFEFFVDYSHVNYETITNAELLLHTVVMSVITLKQFYFVNWKYVKKPKIAEAIRQPDIILSSKSRGVIFDIRYDENITSMSDTAARYIHMVQDYPVLHNWKDVKVVFCKLMTDEKVEIFSTLHPIFTTNLTKNGNQTIE